MRLRKRLERLEQSIITERSCPACGHRKNLLTVITKFPDGRTEGTMPAPCSDCGEVPEYVFEIEVVPARTRVSPPQETTEPQGNEKRPLERGPVRVEPW